MKDGLLQFQIFYSRPFPLKQQQKYSSPAESFINMVLMIKITLTVYCNKKRLFDLLNTEYFAAASKGKAKPENEFWVKLYWCEKS